MMEYVGAALPDLTALLLAVLGLAIVNRLLASGLPATPFGPA